MTQDLSHYEAVLALLFEPAGQGSAQIVGADLGDLGSGAGGGEIAPHVQPLADDGAAALTLFAEGGSQNRVERDDPVRAVSLGAVDADGLVGPVEVLPGQMVHFALASAGVDRHQDPQLPMGRQFGQEALRLVQGQKPTARPIRGFELRDQRARIAEEQAAAFGQLQRLAQGAQLLADRLASGPLVEALRQIALNLIQVQLVHVQRARRLAGFLDEDADQMPALLGVHADRADGEVGARHLHQSAQRFGNSVDLAARGLVRGCVGRIMNFALSVSQPVGGGALVRAAGRVSVPLSVAVVVFGLPVGALLGLEQSGLGHVRDLKNSSKSSFVTRITRALTVI